MANKLQARRTIKRTNDTMKALQQLEDFKLRITAIQNALEKKEFSLSETCHEIVSIGEKIQRVSTVVRPHTVEGSAKRIRNNLKAKFQRCIDKNQTNLQWVKDNCAKPPTNKHRYFSRYDDHILGSLDGECTPGNLKSQETNVYQRFYVVPSNKWLEENS